MRERYNVKNGDEDRQQTRNKDKIHKGDGRREDKMKDQKA
jgi:hypothetical protein